MAPCWHKPRAPHGTRVASATASSVASPTRDFKFQHNFGNPLARHRAATIELERMQRVTIATTNLPHLNRFPAIDAQNWDQIR
jgi:hypothetical protein